nr:MAG TPA: hypothetical protein [Caudoviricetes sp.]
MFVFMLFSSAPLGNLLEPLVAYKLPDSFWLAFHRIR